MERDRVVRSRVRPALQGAGGDRRSAGAARDRPSHAGDLVRERASDRVRLRPRPRGLQHQGLGRVGPHAGGQRRAAELLDLPRDRAASGRRR